MFKLREAQPVQLTLKRLHLIRDETRSASLREGARREPLAQRLDDGRKRARGRAARLAQHLDGAHGRKRQICVGAFDAKGALAEARGAKISLPPHPVTRGALPQQHLDAVDRDRYAVHRSGTSRSGFWEVTASVYQHRGRCVSVMRNVQRSARATRTSSPRNASVARPRAPDSPA